MGAGALGSTSAQGQPQEVSCLVGPCLIFAHMAFEYLQG